MPDDKDTDRKEIYLLTSIQNVINPSHFNFFISFIFFSIFLLVSHLRLSQGRNDPVVGWLNLFVVITLYQQEPYIQNFFILVQLVSATHGLPWSTLIDPHYDIKSGHGSSD